MLILKILLIIFIIFVSLFLLTLLIYFFNLDMKFASLLIKPLTWWYDWSKKRRDNKKKNNAENI